MVSPFCSVWVWLVSDPFFVDIQTGAGRDVLHPFDVFRMIAAGSDFRDVMCKLCEAGDCRLRTFDELVEMLCPFIIQFAPPINTAVATLAFGGLAVVSLIIGLICTQLGCSILKDIECLCDKYLGGAEKRLVRHVALVELFSQQRFDRR